MGRELSVPEKHQLRIAKQTINMPDAMVGVMGGPDKKKSAEIIRRLTGKEPKDYYERGQDSHVADSRRARLHRALDCVLDRSAGRDAELGRVEARISPQLRTLSLPQLKATLASYERKAANVTSSAPDWNHINRVLEELDDEIERRRA
jgi:hypothetical protein